MNTGLSPEQIGARRLGIGGSDAGKVMGGAWGDLWREKTGRSPPEDLSDVLAVQMGTWTEPMNLSWYARKTGRPVTHVGHHVIHPTIGYLRANLDALTRTAQGAWCYLDAKHVGRLDEATVLRYTPQGVHCAIVAAAALDLTIDHWALSVFIGNSKWELVEQAIDPFYAVEYLAQAADFWGYVERDEEPPEPEPIAAPKPQPKLRTLLVPSEDDEVYAALVRQNNWLPEACKLLPDFAGTEPAAKKHAIVREELKRLVPDDIGEFRRGLFKLSRTRAGAVTMKMEKVDG